MVGLLSEERSGSGPILAGGGARVDWWRGPAAAQTGQGAGGGGKAGARARGSSGARP
jgi:hypothetical protein